MLYSCFMDNLVECRKENGQFKRGFSDDPGGGPKDEYRVAELARPYTVEAVERLSQPLEMLLVQI